MFFYEAVISYTCSDINAVALAMDIVYGKWLAQFNFPVTTSEHLKLSPGMSLHYRISNKSTDCGGIH